MATDVLVASGPLPPDFFSCSPLQVWSMDRFAPSSRQPPQWSRNFNWRADQRSRSCLEVAPEPRKTPRKNRGSEVYGQAGVTLRAEDLLEESENRLHPLGKSKLLRIPGNRRSTLAGSASEVQVRPIVRRRSEGFQRPRTSSSSSGQADESSPITSSTPTSSCPDSSSSSSSFSDSGSNCEYCRLSESSDTIECVNTTSSDCDDERSTSSSSATRHHTPVAVSVECVRPRRFRRNSPGDYLRHERDRLDRMRKRTLPDSGIRDTAHEDRTSEKTRRSRKRTVVAPEERKTASRERSKNAAFERPLRNPAGRSSGDGSDERSNDDSMAITKTIERDNKHPLRVIVGTKETISKHRGALESNPSEFEVNHKEERRTEDPGDSVAEDVVILIPKVVLGDDLIVKETEGRLEVAGEEDCTSELPGENQADQIHPELDDFYDIPVADTSRTWRIGSRSLDGETDRLIRPESLRKYHSEPETGTSSKNNKGEPKKTEVKIPENDFLNSTTEDVSARSSRISASSAAGSKEDAGMSSRCTTCTKSSSAVALEEEEDGSPRGDCPLCVEERRSLTPRPPPSPRFLRADFEIEPEIIHRANPLVDEAEVEVVPSAMGVFRRLSEDEFVAILSIHEAARKGDLHVVKLLTKRDPKQMETVDERGWTPIHLAAAHGHDEVVKYLATEGAHLSALDPSSYTAVHLAAMNGHNNCLEVLLPMGVDVDSITAEGFTALHLAVMNVQLDCCQTLLQWGGSVEKKDALGRCAHDMVEEYDLKEVGALLARFHKQMHTFRDMLNRINRSGNGESQSPEPEIPREFLEILASIAEESGTD